MIGRRGYRPYEWKRGVLSVYGDLSNVQRLRFLGSLEQGWVGFSVSWEQPGSDPLIAVSVDVTETWPGRLLLALAIRWDRRRAR